MVVFNQATQLPFSITTHAAQRWLERVGYDLDVKTAKEMIAAGLEENGVLVMEGRERGGEKLPIKYYEWMSLVFPCVKKKNYFGEHVMLAKSTLLKGMCEGG